MINYDVVQRAPFPFGIQWCERESQNSLFTSYENFICKWFIGCYHKNFSRRITLMRWRRQMLAGHSLLLHQPIVGLDNERDIYFESSIEINVPVLASSQSVHSFFQDVFSSFLIVFLFVLSTSKPPKISHLLLQEQL